MHFLVSYQKVYIFLGNVDEGEVLNFQIIWNYDVLNSYIWYVN